MIYTETDMIYTLVGAAFIVGWVVGMWTRRIVDRTCPWTDCHRVLLCPIHDRERISREQARAGVAELSARYGLTRKHGLPGGQG